MFSVVEYGTRQNSLARVDRNPIALKLHESPHALKGLILFRGPMECRAYFFVGYPCLFPGTASDRPSPKANAPMVPSSSGPSSFVWSGPSGASCCRWSGRNGPLFAAAADTRGQRSFPRLRRNELSSITASMAGALRRRSSRWAIPAGHCCPLGSKCSIRSAHASSVDRGSWCPKPSCLL